MDKKRDQKATDKKVKAYNKYENRAGKQNADGSKPKSTYVNYENRAGKQNADGSKPKSEAKGKDGAPILNRR